MNNLFFGISLAISLTSFGSQKNSIEFAWNNIAALQNDTIQHKPSTELKTNRLLDEPIILEPTGSRTGFAIKKADSIANPHTKNRTELTEISENTRSISENKPSLTDHPDKLKVRDSLKSDNRTLISDSIKTNTDNKNTMKDYEDYLNPKNSILDNRSINTFLIGSKKYIPLSLLAILLLTILLFCYILILYLKLKDRLHLLTETNFHLNNELQKSQAEIKNLTIDLESRHLKGTNRSINTSDQEKKVKEFIADVFVKNNLSKSEVLSLTKGNENRWISVGHSAIGKMHTKSVPPLPCQDSNHYELLNHNWNLSIVCDGAGSAKYSHIGSNYFANNSLPSKIKSELSNCEWYNRNEIPSETIWNEFVNKILKHSFAEFREWYIGLNLTDAVEKDFATTLIFCLHNEKCVLIANIGDGRGGYLNDIGEFRPLFIPYKGTESNSTVFITSPIWENSKEYIQTNVIKDNILSIFILSDGLEKVSFNCSILVQKWIDPNLPYRNFFYPILSRIKNLNEEEEKSLSQMWISFIEEGNDLIKSESDDKTMVISFLK